MAPNGSGDDESGAIAPAAFRALLDGILAAQSPGSG